MLSLSSCSVITAFLVSAICSPSVAAFNKDFFSILVTVIACWYSLITVAGGLLSLLVVKHLFSTWDWCRSGDRLMYEHMERWCQWAARHMPRYFLSCISETMKLFQNHGCKYTYLWRSILKHSKAHTTWIMPTSKITVNYLSTNTCEPVNYLSTNFILIPRSTCVKIN